MQLAIELCWDDWNVAHIARHAVTREEVEEVLLGDVVMIDAKKGRLMAIGLTRASRYLTVILDPMEDETHYPVTAYPSSRKQRRFYESIKGGAENAG